MTRYEHDTTGDVVLPRSFGPIDSSEKNQNAPTSKDAITPVSASDLGPALDEPRRDLMRARALTAFVTHGRSALERANPEGPPMAPVIVGLDGFNDLPAHAEHAKASNVRIPCAAPRLASIVAPPTQVGRVVLPYPPPRLPEAVGRSRTTRDAGSKRLRSDGYRQDARDQLIGQWQGTYGFSDEDYYIVDRIVESGAPETLGEGTLHTAIAVIAIATGNYRQDGWEESAANEAVERMLDALTHKSWGNKDEFNRVHPIRHPDDYDYDADRNILRNSPLTRDSFGAIVAACYYAYNCPNSSQAVRAKAKALLQKWMDYLVFFQWKLHSTTHPAYIQEEFIAHEERHINLYDKNHDRKKYVGPAAYILLPHEIYALKNAAASLGLVTVQIQPLADLPVALRQTIADVAAPYLADGLVQVLDEILSLLVIAVPYNVKLWGASGYNFGVLDGVFIIDPLPDSVQSSIVTTFRNAVAHAIREYFRLLSLGQDQPFELIGVAVNAILDQMPDTLGPESWRSVLTTAIEQIARWSQGYGWIETTVFAATLEILKGQEPAVQSFSVWSFAVEFECNPDVTTLMKPVVADFWGYIRSNENPNTLWAWLAEDTGRMNEHLALFATNDLDRWSEFAYGSTKFNDWVTKPKSNTIRSPRLDYLVIDGLAEKGPPAGIGDVATDWWDTFKNIVQHAVENLVAAILNKFESGFYFRELIGAGGQVLRELWKAGGEYVRELFANGVRVERLLSRVDAEVRRWFWDQAGVFLDYYHWQRVLPDGTLAVADLIEHQVRSLAGELQRITWTADHAFESYRRWFRSTVDGAAVADDLAERTLRDLDGVMHKWSWNAEHVFQTHSKWWRSTTDGAAVAVDVVLVMVRDAQGVMEKWTYTTGAAFETYRRWWRSTSDGVAAAADIAERKLRDLSGLLQVTHWTATGGFASHHEWWRSTTAGSAAAQDLAKRSLRDAAGVLEETLWGTDGVFQAHRKWWRSTISGAAVGQDLVERKLRDAQGLLYRWTWNENHIFQNYWRWWRSTADGAAVGADLAVHQFRDAQGVLKQWMYTIDGAFESFGRWWRSAIDGTASAENMVEKWLRHADGQMESWTWGTDAVFQTYWLWAKSALDGGVEPADLRKKLTQTINGERLVETWTAAGDYARSVFDALGNLLEGVNIPMPEWPPKW